MARWRFWAVAFAFLVVMMFATLPSPLYGLYRTRDHLSALTITVVFAIFAAGTSLALFLVGGALIGAGAGAVYKGTTGIVLEATAPENRVAMTSALVIAVFVGLSVPVIGAGVALDAGASPANTVLGFAVFVALGVSLSGWALLGRRPMVSQQAAPPAAPAAKELSP